MLDLAFRDLSLPRLGSARGGGGGVAVNLVAPSITGALTQGANLTFDVGLWAGATSFEIEVRQTNPTATPLPRQAVSGTSTGTLPDVPVGARLTLVVWANGVQATSAEFGPIIAAGDQWIIGLVFNGTTGYDPTPSGSPVSYTRIGPASESGMLYSSGQGWGWTAASSGISNQTRSDVRLAGRVNTNALNQGVRVDLPSGGTYILHMGFGAASTVTPRLQVRDGVNEAAAVLAEINSGLVSVTSSQTMDAAGNAATHAAWTAASVYGGVPIEVTATGGSLWFGRAGTPGAPQLNYIGILKKAV